MFGIVALNVAALRGSIDVSRMRDHVQQLEQQNGLLRNQTINLSNPYAIGRRPRGYGMVPANAHLDEARPALEPSPEAGPHREADGGPPAAARAGALAGGVRRRRAQGGADPGRRRGRALAEGRLAAARTSGRCRAARGDPERRRPAPGPGADVEDDRGRQGSSCRTRTTPRWSSPARSASTSSRSATTPSTTRSRSSGRTPRGRTTCRRSRIS